MIPGIVLMLICAVNYGRSILTRSGNEAAKLHTTGLYGLVRHPLYLATFLFVIGLLIYLPTYSNLIAAGSLITYTCVAIPLEEKKLIEIFGGDYLSYKIRTAALIPFLRRRKKEC